MVGFTPQLRAIIPGLDNVLNEVMECGNFDRSFCFQCIFSCGLRARRSFYNNKSPTAPYLKILYYIYTYIYVTQHSNWEPSGEKAISSKLLIKKDMDRNLKIRLILSKILTNVEFSEEKTIALWEGLARTSLNLEF